MKSSQRELDNYTLEDADNFNKQGVEFYNKGDLNQALEFYNKCLAIQERLAPGSLTIANSYNNIG